MKTVICPICKEEITMQDDERLRLCIGNGREHKVERIINDQEPGNA